MLTFMETIKQASEHVGRRLKVDSDDLLPQALMRILNGEEVPPAVSAWLKDVVRQEAVLQRTGADTDEPCRGQSPAVSTAGVLAFAGAPSAPSGGRRQQDRFVVLFPADWSATPQVLLQSRQSA